MGCLSIKKAFNTIDQELLLKKLDHYGTKNVAYNCIKRNRKQYVSIYNCDSDVVCGVQQGYISRPMLFILYINDICNVSRLLKFVLFGDDTNIFFFRQ